MTPTELADLIRSCLLDAVADGTLDLPAEAVGEVKVERPRQREHGDWATNVAMQLAKKAGTNPRALAERHGATTYGTHPEADWRRWTMWWSMAATVRLTRVWRQAVTA